MPKPRIDYTQYIGQVFNRLTILSLYRNEKDNRQWFHCRCSCGTLKDVSCKDLLRGHGTSCGCARKEFAKENIKRVNEYHSLHPEIYQENGGKVSEYNITTESQGNISKGELRLRSWCQETFGSDNVRFQVPVGNHKYDILINDCWLIEYNGIATHHSDFHNENNPDAKEPYRCKPIDYHFNLLQNALNNGYLLIQVWENQSDEFTHKLIKSQVDGTACIEDYMKDGLLCNDYGFPLSSTIISDTGTWYSDGYHEKVDTSYSKARFLIYNSGYSKY